MKIYKNGELIGGVDLSSANTVEASSGYTHFADIEDDLEFDDVDEMIDFCKSILDNEFGGDTV